MSVHPAYRLKIEGKRLGLTLTDRQANAWLDRFASSQEARRGLSRLAQLARGGHS